MIDERMRRLLYCLAALQSEGDVDCAEAARHFTMLGEAALDGADIHDILPQVAAHVAHCPDCREEYEALLAVLRAEQFGETHFQP